MRLASLVALVSLCSIAACTDDGVPRDRSGTDPGIGVDALVVDPDPMTNCPSSEPKSGENCGPDISESNNCEYAVGECTRANGTIATETVSYCCKLGVWEACGGRSPCPSSEIDAAEPTPVPLDAGVPRDVAPDTVDSGVDAGVD